jgi:transposase InsO family protein
VRYAECHFKKPMGRYAYLHRLASFRSDNATENVSGEIRTWLELEGIRHKHSAPYCQWQDGKAERSIRTEIAAPPHKGGLHGVSKSLHARIRHLRVWGTLCYFLVPKALRKKLDDHARTCLFVGYSTNSKSYVGIESNVCFDETCFP